MVCITHGGYVTIEGYISITCCIQTQGITNALNIHLGVAVDGQLHRVILVLLALAAYVDALNTAFGAVGVDYQLVGSNGYAVSAVGSDCMVGGAVGHVGVEGQCLAFCIDGGRLVHVRAIGIRCCDATVFCKLVGSVFCNDAALIVFAIAVFYAGQGGGECGLYLMIWSKSRIHGAVCIATLTIFSTEGDVSGLQRFARCGEAVGDLHVAGEVLLACRVRTVGELACQSIQDIRDACFVVHRDTSVVRDEGNLRAFCCTLDDGVACFVVLCRFAISFMRIVDIRVATVVFYGRIVGIFHEDIPSSGIIAATCQFRHIAAIGRNISVTHPCDCIVPSSSIFQIQVDGSIGSIGIICHTGPFRVFRRQTEIDMRFAIFQFDIAYQNGFCIAGIRFIFIDIQIDGPSS